MCAVIDNRAQVECSSKIASISQSNVVHHCLLECALLLFASDLMHVLVLVCNFLCPSFVMFLRCDLCVLVPPAFISVWVSFFPFFSCLFLTSFLCETITIMWFLVSAHLPVHLGRSSGASLSWPVTLATRWTSAPSISARGRCS